MKKIPFLLFLVVFLAASSVISASAAQQAVNITCEFNSMSPLEPSLGNEVVIVLDCVNNGAEIFPADSAVGYELYLNGDLYSEPGSSAAFAEELPVNASGQLKIAFFAPTQTGLYAAELRLDGAAQPIIIADKLDVYTALPNSVSQLFAGLGIFIAVMAVMAMGTEVVIEMFKSMLGLKAKVTAMEAFNDLKAELPGKLAGVGVDAAARKKIIALAETAQDKLKPIEDSALLVEKIRAGKFAAAYEALSALKADAPNLAELRRAARAKISTVLNEFKTTLGFGVDLIAKAEKAALDLIDKAQTAEDFDRLAAEVFAALRRMLQNPEDVQNWLLVQMDTFIATGGARMQEIAAAGKEALTGLGFPDAEVDALLDEALFSFEHSAHEQSELFALSVRKLLQAVEYQRNDIQSPARLLWRRLRKSKFDFGVFALLFGVLLGLVLMVFRYPGAEVVKGLGVPDTVAWLLPFVLGLLAGSLLLWLLARLLNWWFKDNARLKPKGSNITVGYFISMLEYAYNRIVGHDDHPDKYGEVRESVEQVLNVISPTTVASTLLARETVHREEEVKRVRAIRIISAFIGTMLAYYMKVDAAIYLGYIVPDIVQQINQFNLHQYALFAFLPEGLSNGMILTGLAASAGSKFWRDLLARLQAARGQAEEAARFVEKARKAVSDLT